MSQSVNTPRSSLPETRPVETRPEETLKQSSKTKPTVELDTKYKPPYVKVDRNNPESQNFLKPFKKAGSTLFKNPFKVIAEKLEKIYI
ncbi:MAG: hypothetical protein ACK41Q_06615 [Candidatus Brocadia sp.]